MKIGIDLKPFSTGSKFRGIGMYTRNLLEEMLKIDNDYEYHFLNLYEKYDGDPPMNERCHLYQYNMGPKVVDVGERQLFLDSSTKSIIKAAVGHFIEKSQIDAMLFTSPNEYGGMYDASWFDGITKMAILYDMIPLNFPQQCLFDTTYKKDYYRSLEFLKQMDLLFAISQSAKDDAVKFLQIPPEKIVVVHAGIDSDYHRIPDIKIEDIKKKFGIKSSFMMFAGGIDFKKNIEDIIVAFAKCGKEITGQYQLLIVGKTAQDVIDKYYQIAREKGVDGKVICTGFISQEDLVALYNITDLLIFPSLYEGFGLPVIEAMACGAKVVTSNCSSLKEIAEGHATLVDPKSVRSITEGIKWVVNHPKESEKLAQDSVAYALSYTWASVAKKVVAAIDEKLFADLIIKESNPCDDGENSVSRIDKTYHYTIRDEEIRAIVRLYTRNRIPFPEKLREELAEQLIMLENHDNLPPYEAHRRIIYDMTVVSEWMQADYITGIGRVSTQVLAELSKRILVVPVKIQNGPNGIVCNRISLENYKVTNQTLELQPTDVFFMPELQLRGVQVGEDHPYIGELRKMGIKTYAVIYDILPLRMPEYFEESTSHQFDDYLKEVVNNYDGILSDSQWVSEDIMAYCKEHNIKTDHQVKTGFFHLGQDTFKNNINAPSFEIKEFFDTDKKVYLMVGTVEPRKGHEIIYDTFKEMWKKGFDRKLCIIGHVGWNMDSFIKKIQSDPAYGDKICYFDHASDADVGYAYRHAACLIQASAGEGFGLPLIEASNYQIPVLCSDIQVFHEVAGNAVNYFDRNNQKEIIDCIERFERGEDIKDSSVIKKTSWKESTDKIYQMIVNDRQWLGEV